MLLLVVYIECSFRAVLGLNEVEKIRIERSEVSSRVSRRKSREKRALVDVVRLTLEEIEVLFMRIPICSGYFSRHNIGSDENQY